ncbi:hypothetical protein SAMN05444156_2680 [Verrucomicrobium sp. GAS474]|uniref:hypothetical protein n=1 Tax=Verrucomicrobium sp. GAS474 TaxID=1882831 RepID=UPI00087B0885|nr:hypothetical protein [Verrucomicrobium sp. GAS474]SDU21987.1 hypothetical protein SAMN05444156_2680 [Verrucomicrobium sp. GAS474]
MRSLGIAFVFCVIGAALGAGAIFQEMLLPERERAASRADALQGEVKEAREAAKAAEERAKGGIEQAQEKMAESSDAAASGVRRENEALKRQLAEEKRKNEELAEKLADSASGKSTAAATPFVVPAAAPKAESTPVDTAVPKGPTLDDLKKELASVQAALQEAQKGRSNWEEQQRQQGFRSGGSMPDEFSSRRINELQAKVDNLQFKVDTFGK